MTVAELLEEIEHVLYTHELDPEAEVTGYSPDEDIEVPAVGFGVRDERLVLFCVPKRGAA